MATKYIPLQAGGNYLTLSYDDGVPEGETGWTELTPSVDSRLIYVSSSTGSNSNDGLSESTPKQTITAGLALLRSGYPDWLMLKAGDVWESEGANTRIDRSGGRGVDEKMVITSYGTGARPQYKNGKFWYGSSSVPLKYFAFIGIDMYASTHDLDSPDYQSVSAQPHALQILFDNVGAQCDDVLIENCRFRFYNTQIQLDGSLNNFSGSGPIPGVVIRRNTFLYALEFGNLISHTDGLILEENIYEKCGWETRLVTSQATYFTEATNCTIRNNVFSRGGNMSIKFAANKRSGTTDFLIENNLCYAGMVGFGHSSLDGSWNPIGGEYSHERGIVRNNIVMRTSKLLPYNGSSYQSFGFNIGNIDDVLFEANIFTDNVPNKTGGQIFRFADPAVERCGTVTAKDNIVWNWSSSLHDSTGSYIEEIGSVDDFIQVNNLPEGVTTYPDPERDIASYNASIGGADDVEEFIATAAAMQKGSWDSRYLAIDAINHIRAGFDLAAIG